MNEVVEITTMVATEEEAKSLARHLVDLRLAACVQITGPVTSIYRWQGEIHEDPEWRLTIKTLRTLATKITQEIGAQHSYDQPEILVLPILEGSLGYINWLTQQVQQQSQQ